MAWVVVAGVACVIHRSLAAASLLLLAPPRSAASLAAARGGRSRRQAHGEDARDDGEREDASGEPRPRR